MPKLIYQDPESGQELSVELTGEAPEITIGRSPGNNIQVNNPSISRRHARCVLEGGQVKLFDLNSSNGTYVNGARIDEETLQDGDRIRLGEFPLDYSDDVSFVDVEIEPLDMEPVAETTDAQQGQQPAIPMHVDLMDSGQDDYPVSAQSSRSVSHSPEFDDIFGQNNFDEPGLFVAEGKVEPFEGGAGAMLFEGEDSEVADDTMVGSAQDQLLFERKSIFDEGAFDPGYQGSKQVQTNPPPWSMQQDEDAPVPTVDENLLTELERLRAKNDELQYENQQLQQGLDARTAQLNEQIEQLQGDCQRLEEDRLKMLQKMEELPTPEEVVSLQQQLADAQQLIQEKDTLVEELKAKIEALEAENAGLKQELEQLRAQLQQAQEQKDLLEDQCEALNAQLGEAQEQIANFSQAGEQSKDASSLDEFSGDNALDELHNTLEQRDADVRRLEDELSQREARLAENEEHIRRLQEQIEQLSAAQRLNSISEFSEDELIAVGPDGTSEVLTQRSDSQVEHLDGASDEIHEERSRLAEKTQELESQVEEYRQLLDEIQQRYEKAGVERDALKQENVAYARETDYLQAERRQLSEQVHDLSQSVQELKQDSQRKKEIFDELSRDLRGLVDENNQLHQHITSLEDQMRQLQSQDRSQELQEHIDALNLQLQKALEEKQAEEARAAQLNEQVEELARQFEETLQARQEVLDAQQQSRGNYEDDEMAQLVAEHEQLIARLKEAEHQLELSQRDGDSEDQSFSEDLKAAVRKMMEEKSVLESALEELILERDRMDGRVNDSP